MIEHIDQIFFDGLVCHGSATMADGAVRDIQIWRKESGYMVGCLGDQSINNIQIRQIFQMIQTWNGRPFQYHQEMLFLGQDIALWLYAQIPSKPYELKWNVNGASKIQWNIQIAGAETDVQWSLYSEGELYMTLDARVDNDILCVIANALYARKDFVLAYKLQHIKHTELDDIAELWSTHSWDERTHILKARKNIDPNIPLISVSCIKECMLYPI